MIISSLSSPCSSLFRAFVRFATFASRVKYFPFPRERAFVLVEPGVAGIGDDVRELHVIFSCALSISVLCLTGRR